MLFVAVASLFGVIGLIACAICGFVAWKLYIVMSSNCDSKCAAATMPPDAYRGKVVWVTGASSGIGKELVVQLARQGAKMIISARRESVLEEVASEVKGDLTKSGGEIRVLPLDLEDLDALPKKAQEAQSFFDGVIDVLVNNGGYSSRVLSKDTEGLKDELAMFKVNFFSCVALAKAVAPGMRERKQGQIINISSLAGKMGVPLRTLYSGSKFAVIGWFDAFRAEEQGFWQSGIVTTNVCPGSVKTDIASNAVLGDGSRGIKDPIIDAGLDVEFTCDRILASAYEGLPEVWIAKSSEIQGAYLNQYFPDMFKFKIAARARSSIEHVMGRAFVKSRIEL